MSFALDTNIVSELRNVTDLAQRAAPVGSIRLGDAPQPEILKILDRRAVNDLSRDIKARAMARESQLFSAAFQLNTQPIWVQ